MNPITTFSALATSTESNGVLLGCSALTANVEAKGHNLFIDNETLRQVKACAEKFSGGVKVKADHNSGFDGIVGALKNFRITGEKLLGDLHLIKSHPKFATIVEISKSLASSVGLSISFSGKPELIGGKLFARCAELFSVDLVSEPAANPSGLFSAAPTTPKTPIMTTPKKPNQLPFEVVKTAHEIVFSDTHDFLMGLSTDADRIAKIARRFTVEGLNLPGLNLDGVTCHSNDRRKMGEKSRTAWNTALANFSNVLSGKAEFSAVNTSEGKSALRLIHAQQVRLNRISKFARADYQTGIAYDFSAK